MSDPSTRGFVGTNSADGNTFGLTSASLLSFYGATPIARASVPVAATDAATT